MIDTLLNGCKAATITVYSNGDYTLSRGSLSDALRVARQLSYDFRGRGAFHNSTVVAIVVITDLICHPLRVRHGCTQKTIKEAIDSMLYDMEATKKVNEFLLG